jgi:spermidine synthase
MIPWTLIDKADIPGGKATLRLLQRGSEFSIRLDQNELMNSRLSGSEEALAELACARIANRERARILIGGLGMGFTLRAALAASKPDTEITVVELMPAVVAWARGPMAGLFDDCLDQLRVKIQQADVIAVIRAARSAYDAILLDVDNGPEGLMRDENDRLYDSSGLKAANAALRPGGVLAVWSAEPSEGFTPRLRRAAFSVEEVYVRARGKRGGARHLIWLATKAG